MSTRIRTISKGSHAAIEAHLRRHCSSGVHTITTHTTDQGSGSDGSSRLPDRQTVATFELDCEPTKACMVANNTMADDLSADGDVFREGSLLWWAFDDERDRQVDG